MEKKEYVSEITIEEWDIIQILTAAIELSGIFEKERLNKPFTAEQVKNYSKHTEDIPIENIINILRKSVLIFTSIINVETETQRFYLNHFSSNGNKREIPRAAL